MITEQNNRQLPARTTGSRSAATRRRASHLGTWQRAGVEQRPRPALPIGTVVGAGLHRQTVRAGFSLSRAASMEPAAPPPKTTTS